MRFHLSSVQRMAPDTERLQVGELVVAPVPIYVVNVQHSPVYIVTAPIADLPILHQSALSVGELAVFGPTGRIVNAAVYALGPALAVLPAEEVTGFTG